MNEAERKFSIELTEILPKHYDIIKSRFKYARVDFIILNRNTLKCIHIEHKQRNINSDQFKTIWIQYTKAKALITEYNNVIFCCNLKDCFIYLFLTTEILNLSREINQYGEDVINIPVECFTRDTYYLKKDILRYLQ